MTISEGTQSINTIALIIPQPTPTQAVSALGCLLGVFLRIPSLKTIVQYALHTVLRWMNIYKEFLKSLNFILSVLKIKWIGNYIMYIVYIYKKITIAAASPHTSLFLNFVENNSWVDSSKKNINNLVSNLV